MSDNLSQDQIPPARTRLGRAMRRFLALESASGIILVSMMVLALVLVNSPLREYYEAVLGTHIIVGIAGYNIDWSVLHWINDGLMAVFFLLVASEIKREVVEGELSSPGQILLPIIAAMGGMAVPSLVYVAFNWGHPGHIQGWAIPSATDIAFSLGVLSVLGRKVPTSLRVFLAALAIIDDLGAIVIIALFYSGDLAAMYLGAGFVAFAVLIIMNRLRVRSLLPYILVGVVMWVFMLNSGIHATIAGVLLGLSIPLKGEDEYFGHRAPLRRLEHNLHPYVAYFILPVFALANSGLSFDGMGMESLMHPVFLGVALGLFVGKQVGIFSFCFILVKLGLARLPQGASWAQLYGVAVLCGIGFTMSLFIGGLAFPDSTDLTDMRSGVMAGSLLSALLGYFLLDWLSKRKKPEAAS